MRISVKNKVLLHACCAPCSTVGVPALREEGYDVVLYFYGGNIHPLGEWEKRLNALRILSSAHSSQLIVRPYDTNEWDTAVRGYEKELEGGARCPICIRLQLENAAKIACELKIPYLCTSLTLSPQKHPDMINSWGNNVSKTYGLMWINRVWRKKGGFSLSLSESRRLGLYRQNYCGCRYSLSSSHVAARK